MIVALSPGHSDITRFRPRSPIATGNHLDRTEKIPKFAQTLASSMFLIHVQAFQDPLCRERPHVQIFMNDGPNPFTWDVQLLSYWFSRNSKISLWVWSIISGVVTILDHPGQGTSQVEKLTHLNWATQFLTVSYDDACSPNVPVKMAWISFGTLPCRKKNFTAHVSMLKSRASHDMLLSVSVTRKDLQFGIWTDPYFQQHYHYDIKKYVGLRTYQHPLVQIQSTHLTCSLLSFIATDNKFLCYTPTFQKIT